MSEYRAGQGLIFLCLYREDFSWGGISSQTRPRLNCPRCNGRILEEMQYLKNESTYFPGISCILSMKSRYILNNFKQIFPLNKGEIKEGEMRGAHVSKYSNITLGG